MLRLRSHEYNIFRWYRAGWGRYTQSDPISETYWSTVLRSNFFDNIPVTVLPSLVSSSAASNYGYVEGNPLTHFDGFGLRRQSRGCDGIPDCAENAARKKCCECHDACYWWNKCQALRDWSYTAIVIAQFQKEGRATVPLLPCVRCNLRVTGCYITSLVGYAIPCNYPMPDEMYQFETPEDRERALDRASPPP